MKGATTAQVQRKYLMRQVIVVGFCAAALSFVSLVRVALDAGVPHWLLACAFPITLDGLMLVAIQGALSPAFSGWVRMFAWSAVLPPLAGTIWANLLDYPHAVVIAIMPPVAFVLTAILAAVMTREPVKPPPPKARPAPTPKPPAAKPAKAEPVKLTMTANPAPPQPAKRTATEAQREVFDKHLAAGTVTDLTAPKLMAEAGAGGKRLAQKNLADWRAELADVSSNGHQPGGGE